MRIHTQLIAIFAAVAVAFTAMSSTAWAQPQQDEPDIEVEVENDEDVEVENDEDVEVEVDVDDDGYIKVGPILGYQLDADDHGIDVFRTGIDTRFALELRENVNIVANPVVQIIPSQIDDELGFDTAVNFLIEPEIDDVRIYGGPGLPVVLNFEDEADTATLGLNAIAGAGVDLDGVSPFIQLRYHRVDISDGPNNWIGEVGVHF